MAVEPLDDRSFVGYRRKLIERIRGRGIDDLVILQLFDRVPRHLFVPEGMWPRAYEDAAIPDRIRPDGVPTLASGPLPLGPQSDARRHSAGNRDGKRLPHGPTGVHGGPRLLGRTDPRTLGAGARRAGPTPDQERRAHGWGTAPSVGGSMPHSTSSWFQPRRRPCRRRSSTSWRRAGDCSSRSGRESARNWCWSAGRMVRPVRRSCMGNAPSFPFSGASRGPQSHRRTPLDRPGFEEPRRPRPLDEIRVGAPPVRLGLTLG